nr:MAG TPA: hypothetical protein [Caudoviricetes sp.]
MSSLNGSKKSFRNSKYFLIYKNNFSFEMKFSLEKNFSKSKYFLIYKNNFSFDFEFSNNFFEHFEFFLYFSLKRTHKRFSDK